MCSLFVLNFGEMSCLAGVSRDRVSVGQDCRNSSQMVVELNSFGKITFKRCLELCSLLIASCLLLLKHRNISRLGFRLCHRGYNFCSLSVMIWMSLNNFVRRSIRSLSQGYPKRVSQEIDIRNQTELTDLSTWFIKNGSIFPELFQFLSGSVHSS